MREERRGGSKCQAVTQGHGRTIIRNQSSARRAKKLRIKGIAAYTGLFVIIISILALSYQGGGVPTQSYGSVSASQASTQSVANRTESSTISIDQYTAANAISSLAETANLPAAGDLREATTTLYIQKQLAQNDTEVISKPDIVQPTTSAERGLTEYTVQEGENLSTIASRFGISAQTLRWANNTTSDAIAAGKVIVVPRVDGIVYTVKGGDTVAAIANKYKVDAERVVLYNDLTSDADLAAGTKLVLPSGELPENERPGYVAPRTTTTYNYSWSSGSMSGSILRRSYGFPGPTAGNRYASGNCTWYSFERRAQLGRPIGGMWGNAKSWRVSAIANGYTVNNTPAPGAVIQTSAGGGGYGHVGIVEYIEGDNMVISDMNYAGYNVVTWRIIPLSMAGSYSYIH